MNKLNNVFLIILLLVSSSCFCQPDNLTSKEKNAIEVFNGFIKHIHVCIIDKKGISDSTEITYLVYNYLFTNSILDSSKQNNLHLNQLPFDRLNNLKNELNTFYRYVQEREDEKVSENLMLMPIRLTADTFIYKKLTSFQKENTFIFYDKRLPNKTLGYLLFMPLIKELSSKPKIWSWTLVYKFGKYVFKSVTGQEGYEYLFSPEEFSTHPLGK